MALVVTPEIIRELKLSYPKQKLGKFVMRNGDECIIRAITKKDLSWLEDLQEKSLSTYQRKLNEEEITDLVLDRCLLFPETTEDMRKGWPIGQAPSIRKQIELISGFEMITIDGKLRSEIEFNRLTIQPIPAWPKPSAEEIADLKAQNGSGLNLISLDNCHFVTRLISKMDLREVVLMVDTTIPLLMKITVYPQNVRWEDLPWGYVDKLAMACMEISRWEPTSVEIEEL